VLEDVLSIIWQALARGGGWDDEDDAGSLRWASAAGAYTRPLFGTT